MFYRYATSFIFLLWIDSCAVKETNVAWPPARPLGADISRPAVIV